MPQCVIDGDESFDDDEEAIDHYETEHEGVVFIDSREKDQEVISEVQRVCLERDLGFLERTMEYGDYVYHGEEREVAIEYKNVTDAINSALGDNPRIFNQASGLAERYDHAWVYVVGKTSEARLRGRNIGYAQASGQIYGALSQIIGTMNVPSLWIRSREKFADVGIRAMIDSGDTRFEDNQMLLLSPGSANDTRLATLMTISNLGKSAAKDIMNEFGSVSAVVDASYVELRSIDGIGSKTARRLWNTFNTEYESPGFDDAHKDHRMWSFFDTNYVGNHILREIWVETDGLRSDPIEYVEESCDMGSKKTQRTIDAIEENRPPETDPDLDQIRSMIDRLDDDQKAEIFSDL